jgi:hypothetical protein
MILFSFFFKKKKQTNKQKGHAGAAAVTLHNETLWSARERLLGAAAAAHGGGAGISVASLLVSRPHVLRAPLNVRDAQGALLRLGVRQAPVLVRTCVCVCVFFFWLNLSTRMSLVFYLVWLMCECLHERPNLGWLTGTRANLFWSLHAVLLICRLHLHLCS